MAPFVRAISPLAIAFAIAALWASLESAVAQIPLQQDPASTFTEAVQSWVAENNVKGAVLVVKRQGKTVVDAAFGAAGAQQAVPLQSLSKAITAACVATLVRDNKISFKTSVSEALQGWFRHHREPADSRLLSATVEQLITHRSGLPSNQDAQPKFWSVLRQHLKGNSIRQPQDDALLVESLKEPMPRSPGEGYGYSNIGYLALAVIIREVSGNTYEEYCRRSVFEPLGISSARLSPAQRLLSGAGGWEMKGSDYLTFYEALATGNIVPASLVDPWIREQRSLPGNASSPIWYGLGTNVREGRQGKLRYFHGGDWDWQQRDALDGHLQFSESSHAVRLEDGTSWFVAWSPSRKGLPEQLEQKLLKAYRSVWP